MTRATSLLSWADDVLAVAALLVPSGAKVGQDDLPAAVQALLPAPDNWIGGLPDCTPAR